MYTSLPERIQQAVAQSLDSYSLIIIAFSGGLDSTVLLHACAHIKSQSKSQRFEFLAVHVNHQLSDSADAWANHCSELAHELGIPFDVKKVDVDRNQASLEAAARSARYKALDGFLDHPQSLLVTAHHANDQAETLLLRLARGAGLTGLRSIHTKRKLGTADLARPLIAFTRQQLEEYAAFYGLRWIEDESNANLEFDRNFLRKNIIPELETRWPEIVNSLGVVARQASEQTALLDQLAKQDLDQALLQDYCFGSCFDLKLFHHWGFARAKNLMRYWLANVLPGEVSVSKNTDKNSAGFNRQQWQQFEALCAQPESVAKICFQANGIAIEFRAYDKKLFICPVEHLEALLLEHRGAIKSNPELTERWVTVLGTLEFAPLKLDCHIKENSKTLKVDDLETLQLAGASLFESIQLNGHQQQLKKLFQLNRVPHWLRADYPVLVNQQIVVAIPGIAVSDLYKLSANNKGCMQSDQAVTIDWDFGFSKHLFIS